MRVAGIDKDASTLALGTAAYTLDRRDHWFELLDAFVVGGGNVLDTARIYAGGQSEQVLGAWLGARRNRDGLIIITKAGHGDNELPADDLEAVIARELATSLETLGIDHVDLFMLHRDNEAVPVERIMQCLHRHVEAGSVRSLGASNWTYPRVQAANAYAEHRGLTPFAAVSNTLSLARPAAPFFPGLVATDEAGERWHEETGIPLIPWSAQARGFFSGRYTPDTADPTNPHDQRMLDVYATPENLERLGRAQKLAAQRGCTAMQIALAWVLGRPYPVLPIVGPRNLGELRNCIDGSRIGLSTEEILLLVEED